MQVWGRIVRTLCSLKEASLKRLHAETFHLYAVLEKAKQQGQKSHQWLPVAKGRGEV